MRSFVQPTTKASDNHKISRIKNGNNHKSYRLDLLEVQNANTETEIRVKYYIK